MNETNACMLDIYIYIYLTSVFVQFEFCKLKAKKIALIMSN